MFGSRHWLLTFKIKQLGPGARTIPLELASSPQCQIVSQRGWNWIMFRSVSFFKFWNLGSIVCTSCPWHRRQRSSRFRPVRTAARAAVRAAAVRAVRRWRRDPTPPRTRGLHYYLLLLSFTYLVCVVVLIVYGDAFCITFVLWFVACCLYVDWSLTCVC